MISGGFGFIYVSKLTEEVLHFLCASVVDTITHLLAKVYSLPPPRSGPPHHVISDSLQNPRLRRSQAEKEPLDLPIPTRRDREQRFLFGKQDQANMAAQHQSHTVAGHHPRRGVGQAEGEDAADAGDHPGQQVEGF